MLGLEFENSELQDKISLLADSLLRTKMETWNFGESVGFEGLMLASDALDRPELEFFLRGWLRGWAARRYPFRRLDTTIPGHAAVKIALKYKDDFIMEALVETSNYLRTREKLFGVYKTWDRSPLLRPYGGTSLSPEHSKLLASPPAGVFIDCLHFDPPFFAALANAVDDRDLMDDAADQAVSYINRLQDPSGFFWHFALEGQEANFGPSWGRGQGWALLGLVDVIQEIQSSLWQKDFTSQLEVLHAAVNRLVNYMVSTQQEDGHWSARVETENPTPEASTAAFMYVGILRAANLGIVHFEAIRKCIESAFGATLASVEQSGLLDPVSAAVMACTEPSHYDFVPTGFMVPWGQGPALMALCEAITHD